MSFFLLALSFGAAACTDTTIDRSGSQCSHSVLTITCSKLGQFLQLLHTALSLSRNSTKFSERAEYLQGVEVAHKSWLLFCHKQKVMGPSAG